MAAPYVTDDEILAAVGITSPTAAQSTWAEEVAAAIEAIIADRLGGDTPSAGFEARLNVAAVLDGARLFKMKDAPTGNLNIGPDGEVVNIGSSQTRALDNVFLPGIG